MAKRRTNRSRSSSRSKKSSQQLDLFAGIQKWRSNPQSRDQTRKVFAWTLIFGGILAFIAGISHFGNGGADLAISEASEAQNMLGYAGARIAQLYISQGFGLPGLVIPLYVGFWGLVLLEKDFSNIARRMLKFVVFGVLFGSMLLAFIVDASGSANFDLGGAVGHYLSRGLTTYSGRVGTGFLMLFALIVFLVLTFNAEIRASGLLNRIMAFVDNLSGIKLIPAMQGANSSASSAPKNKPASKPRTKPAPKNGDSLKERMGKLLDGEQPAASSSSRSASPEPSPSQAQTTKEPPAAAEPGEQIAFDLKTPKEPVRLKVENEDLELEIAEPLDEPEADLEVVEGTKEFIPLGDDNIGKVVGADTIEKIVAPEDQENDEIEDFEAFDPTAELSAYEMPTRNLLDEHGDGQNREVNRDELVENKNKIVSTLSNYGIDIVSIKATIGPTVTLYEIVPAPGVRISRIRNLEDDIALSLAALGIRIIAPIPGRGTIGIEVPNSTPEIVSLKGVLATEKFRNSKAELPIALGRTIDNSVFVGDLNKMPHLLIAGATGQGKSVGLNTVIASILYKRHPAEVKFVLIDPKKVEMSLYQSLEKHYLATLPNVKEPIITDVRDAITVLKSLCIEMDQRYELLKTAKVRNLKEYNKKFLNRKLSPRKGHFYMPYIVLVIDELADMMMVGGKEVEMPIARLAQLARAVGIHLVVATQRPSVNVITGIIKANFPARMSYRVISKVDSRTILDANGADQLIGRGDMLFSTGSEIVRIQNAFIDTPEVENLVNFISSQRGFPEPYYLPELPSEGDDDDAMNDEPLEMDSMFDDAARMVVRYQMGSASLLQRKLKLGYNRAGRIIDQLERAGIVGPHSGSKARDVLFTDEASLEQYLETLG
ncbi:MAG: DNA translocase FtsK [Bacteroidia bacterium]